MTSARPASGSIAAVTADEGARVHHLLDNLVDAAKADPASVFEPATIRQLAELRKNDRGAYESLRARLKKVQVRVVALDDAISEELGESGRGPTQSDILIKIAAGLELFHARDGVGYADIETSDHRETWPIRSRGFRQWLAMGYYKKLNSAPNNDAMQAALGVIEARAQYEAPGRQPHVRVGKHEGKLYLDLCDDKWRAVEIDADGWRVIDRPPIRFRRSAGMMALPIPKVGGSVADLRRFLNVRSDEHFILTVAWLLQALSGKGPYPVLALTGEQGSAKSTFARMLRALVDPNTAPLRSMPRSDDDLFIAAANAMILCFDNISAIPAWIADTICRLATGGGAAKRMLYSDSEEVIFEAVRPVILNGIEDIVSRPDLADRALFLVLDPIADEQRMAEAELWAAFDAAAPRILGALLHAVSVGIRRLPDVRLSRLPRLADFAKWAVACEHGLWPAGSFIAAYDQNRAAAVADVIEADPVGAAVRSLMSDGRTVWTGTAAALLAALAGVVSEQTRKGKDWPASPRGLSGRLRRASAFLRRLGVNIEFGQAPTRSRTRTITITAPENGVQQPSAPSDRPKPAETNGSASDGCRTVGRSPDGGPPRPSETKPLNNNALDGSDGSDGRNGLFSEPPGLPDLIDADPDGDELPL